MPSSSSSSSVKSQSQLQSQSQSQSSLLSNDNNNNNNNVDDFDDAVDVAGSKQNNVDNDDNDSKKISTTNVTTKNNDHTVAGVKNNVDVIEDESSSYSSPSSNTNTSNSKDHYYSITLFGEKYEYTLFNVWRIAFYILMAYSWHHIHHGPFGGPWHDSMTYDHTEFVYDMVSPKTLEEAERLRWFGFGIALLSTFNNQTTIIFALLTGQHVFTSLVMFINHHYLFFLLSTLMAIYCNCSSSSFNKVGWLHALRGQIVVVYAYASLWKFDIDWVDGTIVKNIFLSFEEQGANRGVPWNAMYETYGQQLFVLVAVGGVLLDTMLFLVLLFLKPGHKLQSMCIVFHGFTGYTMSQRIGYAFPLAMILASLLFQPSPLIRTEEDDDTDQQSCCGDTLSHAEWLLLQIRGGSYQNDQGDNNDENDDEEGDDNDDEDEDEDEDYIPDDDDDDDDHNINEDDIVSKEVNNDSSNNPTTSVEEKQSSLSTTTRRLRHDRVVINRKQRRRRHTLPLLWLLLQWLIPLRMPLLSNMEYKHTFEGYRWSWTMMLHGKVNMHSPGLSYMTLRPECNGNPYPNPSANTNIFSDIHSFNYEETLVNSIRSSTVMQMFPRQMPKVFHEVDKIIGSQCTNGQMVMKTAYFSSTNSGPYHRIIDPTVDLLETYRAHRSSNWSSKFWYALVDKAPPGHEFILRGTGSISSSIPLLGGRGGGEKDKPDEITFIDRSSCLQDDPIRIHNNHFTIQFDTDYNSGSDNISNNIIPPFRLLIRGCPEGNLQNCHDVYLNKGEKRHFSALRTITISIDKRKKLDTICSESTKEDIVIKLTQIQKPEMMQQQIQSSQQ